MTAPTVPDLYSNDRDLAYPTFVPTAAPGVVVCLLYNFTKSNGSILDPTKDISG